MNTTERTPITLEQYATSMLVKLSTLNTTLDEVTRRAIAITLQDQLLQKDPNKEDTARQLYTVANSDTGNLLTVFACFAFEFYAGQTQGLLSATPKSSYGHFGVLSFELSPEAVYLIFKAINFICNAGSGYNREALEDFTKFQLVLTPADFSAYVLTQI